MESMLSTLAFALLIGGQFLAAIVLISKRNTIYAKLGDFKQAKHPPPEQTQTAVEPELPAKAA
jgi:hypothetical protein